MIHRHQNNNPTTFVDDTGNDWDTAQMNFPWTCYSEARDFASRSCRFAPVPEQEAL